MINENESILFVIPAKLIPAEAGSGNPIRHSELGEESIETAPRPVES